MTNDVKIYVDLLSNEPIDGKYLRRGDRHAVRFTADDAVFRVETDGKSVKVVKTAKIGYELILGESSRLTLKTASGEFVEPDVATHSIGFSVIPDGFTLDVAYSLPPHDERKVLRLKCEK